MSNLGLVIAGMEMFGNGGGGYLATLRAFVLIRGRTSTALSLALPMNLTMAAIEALFQYRIVRSLSYYSSGSSRMGMVMVEAVLIFYLYSILVLEEDSEVLFPLFNLKSLCLVWVWAYEALQLLKSWEVVAGVLGGP